MPDSVVDRVDRAGEWLVPHVKERAPEPRGRRVAVEFPVAASAPFHLTDTESGVDLRIKLAGARDAEAELADGYIVYRSAHATGGDVVHRVTAEGTEDYVSIERAPSREELTYEVELGPKVAGLRLVENVLEVLDASGSPRLRMAPPYVVGAGGDRRWARVEISGCSYDADARAPWGRAIPAPGAARCEVRVAWAGEGVRYPAVVDPAWTSTGTMVDRRLAHTASVITGGLQGRVLVVGGITVGNYGYPTGTRASAELYDVDSGTWASSSAPGDARSYHTATVLQNGKVLVVGGKDYDASGVSNYSSAKLYDPSSGQWSSASSMTKNRAFHSSTLLASGKVLVAGGEHQVIVNGLLTSPRTNTAELYDPTTDSWSSVADMSDGRDFHTATLLGNGKVLVAGGYNDTMGTLLTAEVYDPATDLWSYGFMNTPRALHGAVKLGTSVVLVAGGHDTTGPGTIGAVELYDPSTDTWTNAQSMSYPRDAGTASLLPTGSVLMAGGFDDATTVELYDPSTGNWNSMPDLSVDRLRHTASVLPNGKVLIAGGLTWAETTNNSSELFSLDAAGESCAQGFECASGFCVDGVCCNSACSGVCQACSAAKKGSGSDGQCGPIGTGTDPDNECTAGGGTCAPTGVCNGAGACHVPAQGTSCGASSCSNGSQTDPICNGSGTCTNSVTSCAPYQCGGSTCKTSCSADADCVNGHFCLHGWCIQTHPTGSSWSTSCQLDAQECNLSIGGLDFSGSNAVLHLPKCPSINQQITVSLSETQLGNYTLCNGSNTCTKVWSGVSISTSLGPNFVFPAGCEPTLHVQYASSLSPQNVWYVGSPAGATFPEANLTMYRNQQPVTNPCGLGGSCLPNTACVSASCPNSLPAPSFKRYFIIKANQFSDYEIALPCNDGDLDGVCDQDDNCPSAANTSQADADSDGVGNACDPVCVTIQRGTAGTVNDAQIASNAGSTNYGSSVVANAGDVNGSWREALFFFDLGLVPSGATITSATAAFYEQYGFGSGHPIDVHRVTSSWSESTVTWSGFAAAYDTTAVGTLAMVATLSSGGFASVDLTTLVQQWYAGTVSNYGINLRQPHSQIFTTISSSESTTAANRPALTVCYTAP